MTHLLGMSLACVAIFGCAGNSVAQDQKTPLKVRKEWHEFNSAATKKSSAAVTDSQAWAKLWNSTYGNRQPAPAVPTIDFSKQMVLAVCMGEKPTGGYDIRITKVIQTPKGLEVYVRQTTPPPDAMTAQVLTAPFHFVLIDKVGGAVTWVDDNTAP